MNTVFVNRPGRAAQSVLLLVSTAILVAALAAHNVAFGQEGYPLDGTWRGEWGAAGHEQSMVTIVLSWDGTNVNGIVNPGPDSMKIKKAVLDPSKWSVYIEAASKDGASIVIDSVLNDIGSYHRVLNGTWTAGGVKYPFHVVRQ